MSLTDEPRTAPRWPWWLALGLSVLLVAGVLAAAAVVRGQRPGPLALPEAPAPGAASAACAGLLDRVPGVLDGGERGALDRRALARPAPPGVAAWGAPPVVLRCGVDRPAGLTLTSRLLVVSGVQFLEVPGAGTDTWVAVDRPVYVAVELPAGIGSAPLQQLSDEIRASLPPQRLDLQP